MPFGLTIGTERAQFLQNAIQDELTKRGYSQDADPVMAEYITIMIINNKTATQITAELEDLIGADFDPSFTDWLFAEASKTAATTTAAAEAEEPPAPQPTSPRPLYQQAISQALPSTSSSVGQKRPASPTRPAPATKTRRTDPPTAPRAMGPPPPSAPKSLLERVGARAPPADAIQARIDTIINNTAPVPGPEMQHPLMLQEMMMNQMAMMAAMGMMNPAAFGMQGEMPMGMYAPGPVPMIGVPPQQVQSMNVNGRRQPPGAPRPTPNRPKSVPAQPVDPNPAPPIAAPTPAPAPVAAAPPPPAFTPPERPLSPTLCKFSLKCTNPYCRFSHPSPVATPESGIVLSNEPCPKGRACDDKDCVKGHVSPAKPTEGPPAPGPAPAYTPCRFGASCTRPSCPYVHPSPASLLPTTQHHFAQQCRFGASCTRASCPFQHPPSRVFPHQPQHQNKSVTFGAGVKERLREVEERKKVAEREMEAKKRERNAEREGEEGAATTAAVSITA